MSWIQKLYETYERCWGHEPDSADPLMPICHTMQQAHIEIVLDGNGSFKRASVLDRGANNTLIPCTEESGGRSGKKPVNHPLCDKLQYVAGDYLTFGGKVTSGFSSDPAEPHRAFLASLKAWSESQYGPPKLKAIFDYIQHGRLISDLVDSKILHVDEKGKLLDKWGGDKDQAPAIFKIISNNQTQKDAFIRWRVEEVGDPVSGTWEDDALISAWIAYYQSTQIKRGYCMVSGKETFLAVQHPAKLRHGGDKAKLISSNDTSGYTFRGKFLDSDQAAGVSFDVTQKAHNALRWLIKRQGYHNGDQTVVSWSVSGKPVPDPLKDSLSLFLTIEEIAQLTAEPDHADIGDAGQAFALRMKKAIAGYRAKLDPTEDIVIMGLDSATPGRMAITFYRELKGSDFLDRIQAWHKQYAWLQNFSKESRFVGTPAPRDIAVAAFGRRLDDTLSKTTVERLLPCIVEGRPFPRDLVDSIVHRTCNRVGLDHWEWEKNLGIACGLYNGFFKEREYQMTLEAERTSRDYLYGRLLAIAEHIEGRALYVGGESRDTSAVKLMQRFADRPASTWRTIELALAPSKSRLRAKRPPFIHEMNKLLDEVISSFRGDDFLDDRKLSGEFLLGYHCQRQVLNPPKADTTVSEENNPTE